MECASEGFELSRTVLCDSSHTCSELVALFAEPIWGDSLATGGVQSLCTWICSTIVRTRAWSQLRFHYPIEQEAVNCCYVRFNEGWHKRSGGCRPVGGCTEGDIRSLAAWRSQVRMTQRQDIGETCSS